MFGAQVCQRAGRGRHCDERGAPIARRAERGRAAATARRRNSRRHQDTVRRGGDRRATAAAPGATAVDRRRSRHETWHRDSPRATLVEESPHCAWATPGRVPGGARREVRLVRWRTARWANRAGNAGNEAFVCLYGARIENHHNRTNTKKDTPTEEEEWRIKQKKRPRKTSDKERFSS